MPIEIGKINFDKHYLTVTSQYVKEIAQPLRQLGITMFDHFRLYDDNSGLDLTTVPDFCELYAKAHLYREGCAGNFDDYHDGYYFWDTLGSAEVFKALEQKTKAAHGVMLIKTNKHYCDHFYLGGDLNNPGIKNFFITHRDLIEIFIDYYYERAKGLIDNARQHSYVFPDDKKECDELLYPYGEGILEVSHLKEFLTTQVSSPTKKLIPLTPRERQCIHHTALGQSAKMIASQFMISERTVERHLENARSKLGVRNKAALLKAVYDMKFDFLLP